MLRKVRAGKADYHFIEVMACPGGCVGGGGTPVRSWKKVKARLDAAYELDKQDVYKRQDLYCLLFQHMLLCQVFWGDYIYKNFIQVFCFFGQLQC